MILEHLLTAYLKHRHAKVLQLENFDRHWSVQPRPETEYLLYVHVPFCEELCPYCSFNRMVFQRDVAKAYFQALHEEIALYAEQGFDFPAVYVGGGTPTVMPDEIGSAAGSFAQDVPDQRDIS